MKEFWMVLTPMLGVSSIILICVCICMAWCLVSPEPQQEVVSSDDAVMPPYVSVVESEA